MQRNKWFKIVIYLMLFAMVASTLVMVIQPLVAR